MVSIYYFIYLFVFYQNLKTLELGPFNFRYIYELKDLKIFA